MRDSSIPQLDLESQTYSAINPSEFLTTVENSLGQGKLEEAIACVQSRWSCPQVIELLKDSSASVRKVAALALSLIGDRTAVQPLAVALHDHDLTVVEVAENALWSTWFRLGKPAAVKLVKCGNTHLHHGNYVCAIERFTHAVHEDADFAEAYNQRAIALYLSERYVEAIADCKATLERMPQHFGAMSGMGHCHAHLGEWAEARQCYRLALAIHPRLDGIAESLEQVRQILREGA